MKGVVLSSFFVYNNIADAFAAVSPSFQVFGLIILCVGWVGECGPSFKRVLGFQQVIPRKILHNIMAMEVIARFMLFQTELGTSRKFRSRRKGRASELCKEQIYLCTQLNKYRYTWVGCYNLRNTRIIRLGRAGHGM